MNKKFTKDMVCLDIETTGINKKTARIVQLSVTKFNSSTGQHIATKNWYIKPTGFYEIDEAAQRIHNITKEYLEENGVTLKSIYNEFMEFKEDCDILSYNGTTFDFPILERDFEREGLDVKLDNHRYFDSFHLERIVHANTLSACYKRYTGKEIEDAHNASADVSATIEVFIKQIEQLSTETDQDGNNVIEKSFDDVTKDTITSPEGWVTWSEDGRLIFKSGKYKFISTNYVVSKDPDYIKWLVTPQGDGNNVTSMTTKRAISREWKKHCEELKQTAQNSKN